MQQTPSRDAMTALYQSAQKNLEAGRPDTARAEIDRLLAAAPDAVEALVTGSRIAFEQGDREACLAWLDRALALSPEAPKLWFVAAMRFGHFGLTDRALDAFDRAVRLDHAPLRAQAEKARTLQSLGRFDEADALFRKLLKRHPEDTELYRVFFGARKAVKGEPALRAMSRLWTDPRLNDHGRVDIGFALAKAMDDLGEPKKVFPLLRKANAAQRRLAPFDADAQEAELAAALAFQDGADLTPLWPDDGGVRPVFVTGLPRSGTTLAERIIAAHSAATAGGEMGHAARQAWMAFGVPPKAPPLASLDAAALADWRDRYFRMVARDTGVTSGVVTDKSIRSHLVFGLIRRALPGARIVVVHRDPRDVALSIYRNHFKLGTHRYANDLADIAATIKQFRRAVAHWRDRMPGVIHEVRYEDLVADPEPQARALVTAAGLDWEDACLRFHEQAGAVQTLSLAQVRQPIHAGRRAAWRQLRERAAALHPGMGRRAMGLNAREPHRQGLCRSGPAPRGRATGRGQQGAAARTGGGRSEGRAPSLRREPRAGGAGALAPFHGALRGRIRASRGSAADQQGARGIRPVRRRPFP